MVTAHRRAGRLARQVRDPARDRDDHCQDLLVDLISRADRFDPARGTWDAFVTVVTRHAALTLLARNRSSVVIETISPDDLADPAGPTEAAALLSIDMKSARRRLPLSLCEVLDAIAEEGCVTGAQRIGTQPAATFYRALRQLRLRLIAGGLAPQSVIKSRRLAAAGR
ncbi:MAG: sigma-70 family RNA polymerase sigma factor [Aestuariivirga sp.]|nr:sigma-70 family RNA polymerase sigma factor [Aestuariivirga sp.]